MVKVRQDAWSHEDDLLLAETVLRHIREGSTQLKAFDEVGDHLNRTSAACGFRWNAEVRKKYIQAIDIAKRQRKEKKRAIASQQKVDRKPFTSTMVFSEEDQEEMGWKPATQKTSEPAAPISYQEPVYQNQEEEITFEHVIRQVKALRNHYHASSKSQSKAMELEQENAVLKEEKAKLEQKIQYIEKQYNAVQEDYQVLIQIMDRARKMVVFDEDDQSKAAFRMEKNGNLEQVAK
ncbi:RsfA family transcriptional regulator [Pontibacillus salicampi]|uniref:RsfA family transcriptional regulator n=1 Tax=Pontibacillus salicampi TaxID=1449801 RepID=A0ABV6LJG6_9BACI